MKLPLIDSIVFFALVGGNIIFGASFFFRNRTPDQFTSGSRNLPALVTLSQSAGNLDRPWHIMADILFNEF